MRPKADPLIVVAILAHNHPNSLIEQIQNVRDCVTGARVIVFNGGNDYTLTDRTNAEVCEFSEKVRWGCLHRYGIGVAKSIWKPGARPDFLVLFDSDQLFIRPGYEEYLPSTMADCGYMAMQLHELTPKTSWVTGRRFLVDWKNLWAPLLGANRPLGCHNPGQVWSGKYIDRLLAMPNLGQLVATMDAMATPACEETVFPTLADAFGLGIIRNPASAPGETPYDASVWRENLMFAPDHGFHSPKEVLLHRASPDTYWLHKIGMAINAPDRRFVTEFVSGVDVDIEHYEATFREVYGDMSSFGARGESSGLHRAVGLARDSYKDLRLRFTNARTLRSPHFPYLQAAPEKRR